MPLSTAVKFSIWGDSVKRKSPRIANPLTLRTQSNLWFGQLDNLYDWGAPHGHGAVWKNEAVSSGAISEPFHINGFSQATLHLRNNGGTAIFVQSLK